MSGGAGSASVRETSAAAAGGPPVSPAGTHVDEPVDEPIDEHCRWRPAAPLRPLVAHYTGYRQRGVPPALHRGLPSPFLTLIFTLDEPMVLLAHPDPRQPPGDFAWRQLLRTGGTARISDLAAETGWSGRHLTGRFRTEIGLTPKAAARVIRFDRARHLLISKAADRAGQESRARSPPNPTTPTTAPGTSRRRTRRGTAGRSAPTGASPGRDP